MARLSQLLASALLVTTALGVSSARAAEPQQRLAIAVVDQRSSGRVALAQLTEALESALGVAVESVSDQAEPANLGLLSVVVTQRGAMLQWTLPDGRGESRSVSHGPTPHAIVARIAKLVGDMALAFASSRSIAEGDLVDPYFNLRPRMPAPWSDATPRWERLRPLDRDLVDPFEPESKGKGKANERPVATLDPWKS